jgi:quinol monooxygenase YgiN
VFESHPGKVTSIQDYVIKIVIDLRQVDGFLRFPPSIKLTATNNWNIVEISVKHHKTN